MNRRASTSVKPIRRRFSTPFSSRFALYKEPNRSVGSLRRNIRIYDNNVDSDNTFCFV